MNLRFSDELRRVVDQSETPIEVRDEQTGRAYYILSQEQYRRLVRSMKLEQVDPSFYEFTARRDGE